jgi:uncharacterized protein YdeI (YjbR/CyaY-like superfamily)
MRPVFFAKPADFRKWLERHHAIEKELLVGFYKKGTGKASITWPESVDQALCFGWIDGIRKSFDADSYTIRFTPRKAGSTWSVININKVAALTEAGLMMPAGLAAFEKRTASKSAIYSFEQAAVVFTPAQEKQFKRHKKAWNYFKQEAPSYRKAATWWVISAKQEVTRQKRLAILIADSTMGLRIASLRRTGI